MCWWTAWIQEFPIDCLYKIKIVNIKKNQERIKDESHKYWKPSELLSVVMDSLWRPLDCSQSRVRATVMYDKALLPSNTVLVISFNQSNILKVTMCKRYEGYLNSRKSSPWWNVASWCHKGNTPVLRHYRSMTYWVYKGQSMMYPNLKWFKI